MFKKISKIILSIGKTIFSFLEYLSNKRLVDAIEAKHKAEQELEKEKNNKITKEKQNKREKNIEKIDTEVESVEKTTISKKPRIIEG